jgi:hypothetical protein
MRPGAFSVSVDERGLSDPVTDIINNVMSALQVRCLRRCCDQNANMGEVCVFIVAVVDWWGLFCQTRVVKPLDSSFGINWLHPTLILPTLSTH